MKLINCTRIPDAILEAVLLRAAKSIGSVRTAGVVVKVTQAQPHSGIEGTAYNCDWVRWVPRSARRLKTDGGAYRITLPMVAKSGTARLSEWASRYYDPLARARSFFSVARHEWGHIRDYQNGGRFALAWSRRGNNGRRPLHDRRPEELRTENYAHDADCKGRTEDWACDEIMSLAIELERKPAEASL